MANIKISKKASSSTYPVKAIDAVSQKRVEPLLTPELLRQRHLFGIPLKSPITKQELTKEQLQDFIDMALNELETEAKIDIAPVQRRHRLPFARDLYDEYVYCELPNKPILSVDEFSIRTSNDVMVYNFPPEWIETANFIDGRINIVPLSPGVALTPMGASSPSAGGGFLVMIGLSEAIPAYWEVKATHGFSLKSGIPMIVNKAIGLKAAMNILNNLIMQFQYSSFSLGIDGTSQSQTTQAPQLYEKIRMQYQADYDSIVSQLKMLYNNTIIVSMF